MSTTQIIVLVVVAVVIALVVGALLAAAKRKKRSAELRGTFGPEYDRTVEGSGKRRDAERDLLERKQQHEELQIRPLSQASRARYLTAWDGVQNRFVDSPVLALSEADALVSQMMGERGFPTGDVRHAENMLSVEHAHVLENFRAGHAIEQANSTNRANTEQVRQGMLHFRSVFEELVSEGGSGAGTDQDEGVQRDGGQHDGGQRDGGQQHQDGGYADQAKDDGYAPADDRSRTDRR